MREINNHLNGWFELSAAEAMGVKWDGSGD